MAGVLGDWSRYQLPQELREVLRSGKTFRDIATDFKGLVEASKMRGDAQLDPSLQLHGFIEDVGREIDGGNTYQELLPKFLAAEYTLFALTSSVELPLNAYLIHWLESIATWEKRLDTILAGDGRGKATQTSVEQQTTVLIARLEFIQRLLMHPTSLRSLGDITADSFLRSIPPAHRHTKFDVQTWIRQSIGRQSIIWEDETSMSTFREMITAVWPLDRPIDKPLDLTDLHRRASADEIYAMLRQDPDAVRLAILRMPFAEIRTFDTFTRLLAYDLDAPLAAMGSGKQQLIRDFLQSALNGLESLSGPGEDREREARAVQLVATFVKGLFRGGHVVWMDIEWQLKELTARYSWVAEVKELPRPE